MLVDHRDVATKDIALRSQGNKAYGSEEVFLPGEFGDLRVSDSETSMGMRILENLNRLGFRGQVSGIGRKEGVVAGRPVFSYIDHIPHVPDLAVLLVPAAAIPDALEACGRKGVSHAIIENGGFSEFGEERRALERKVAEIAQRWGITTLGPNCVGTINVETGLCVQFISYAERDMSRGAVSVISQSGGLIHEIVRRCAFENVGLNKLASVGNKLMVDENDLLQFLVDDPGTRTIGLYLESIKDGRRLMNLASSTEKPVVALKGNTSPLASDIAAFHTAVLTGDEVVTSAAFKQAGIHHVRSFREMVDTFKMFSLPLLKGPNLVLLSRSGGRTVTLADQAHRRGFCLPGLSRTFLKNLSGKARAGVIKPTNPVDLGDIYHDPFYIDLIRMDSRAQCGRRYALL